MPKPHFQLDKIIPSTADLRWATGKNLPYEVLERWLKSDRTAHAQHTILSDYAVHGVVVESDSSGLTRLSAERHVLEVLLLIHYPKQIIFECGAAIGGQGIGTWKADNTCMFYPSPLKSLDVLEQMALAQKTIQRECTVQVGMGVRRGQFYEVQNTLFGPAFQVLDAITEDEIGPTAIVWEGRPLVGHESLFHPFDGVDEFAPAGTLWSVQYASLTHAVPRRAAAYPMPFSAGLIATLQNVNFSDAQHLDALHAELLITTHVCFIKLHVDEGVLLLEKQLQLVAWHYLIRETAHTFGIDVAEYAGPVVIVLEASFQAMVAFIQKLCAATRSIELSCSFGMAYGHVLRELKKDGSTNIVGGAPVNYASKLAEDVGVPDHLHLLENCQAEAAFLQSGEAFTLGISHVELKGTRIRL
ncbi:hypothetical protein [Hymenobacter properus]|uniref:Uncharacterized protein n=1 Tax=Hymenobacter properus TaxID=2791026 RepID=A0A931FIK5_9BACT|nr:hypothetical protein [Hymenobacter properus]MBF9140893.1 hypothetical protein [Hymenobacter properus]MBR7719702.1 hypothetical protein [Microvirga sp. SRT04]